MCAILIALPFLIVGVWFFSKYLILVMVILVIGAALSGLLDAFFGPRDGGDSDDEAGP